MRYSDRGIGRVALSVVTALTCAGCGLFGAGTRNPFTDPPAESRSWSPDEIDRAEIVERGSNDLTAMALIRRLRPAWLRARGQDSISNASGTYPVVYIDEIRHGGLATLDQIPTAEIQSLQFFSAADATTRWGTGHPSGVINVVTGR